MKGFATTDLYERVRGDLIATGIIRRTTRRRFGFRFRETHRAADPATPFRVRAAIRDAITRYDPEQPDYRTIARAGLVAATGLIPHLYPTGTPVHRHRQRLHTVLHSRPDTTISDIANAITPRLTPGGPAGTAQHSGPAPHRRSPRRSGTPPHTTPPPHTAYLTSH